MARMDAANIILIARQRCAELPGSSESQPFGEEADVWKVRGKVFALLGRGALRHPLTLKAEPEFAGIMRGRYSEIRPGYHMNKKHWITVYPGEGLDGDLLRDLVTDSYLAVVRTLPRTQRPVDPSAFGRA